MLTRACLLQWFLPLNFVGEEDLVIQIPIHITGSLFLIAVCYVHD